MVKEKMHSSIKRRRALYRLLLLGLVILILALLGWQFYKYKIVNKGIMKAFVEKTNNLYSLQYDHIQLDEVQGTLQIKDIEILADTGTYNEKKDFFLKSLSIPELTILRVKTPKALLNNRIVGGKIQLLSPTFEILMGKMPHNSGLAHSYLPVYKELLGKFLQIKFDSIQVSHAHLLVRNMKTKAIEYEAKNVSILLSQLEIDSTINQDSSRILFSKHFDVSCDEFTFPTADHQYRLHMNHLAFSSQKCALQVGEIHVAPLWGEEEFSKKFGMDRFDFLLEGIQLGHINMESLWHKRIVADQLLINKSSFRIYRDLSFPDDMSHIVHIYPQKQIQGLPVEILIRKTVFRHSFIEYKEKNARSDSSGKLQFYQAHATITNISNWGDAISKNNKCSINFGANLLNKVAVHAKVILLLKDPNGEFSFQGNSKAIDATALNPLSMPMGLVKIEKGSIKNCEFNFRANDSSSTGQLMILYDDFRISLIKKDKKENKYDKKVVKSLASDFIVKKSNPGKSEHQRIAKVHFVWHDSKSFLNVIWNSIFIGIKQSVGMDKF